MRTTKYATKAGALKAIRFAYKDFHYVLDEYWPCDDYDMPENVLDYAAEVLADIVYILSTIEEPLDIPAAYQKPYSGEDADDPVYDLEKAMDIIVPILK